MKKGIIDIHCHVIPKVDDGASDMNEALSMLRCAETQGVGTVIATPHSGAFDGFFNPVRKRFEELKKRAREEKIAVDLKLGAEVYVDRDQIVRAVRRLKRHRYPTLDGTEYVLIEFNLCSEDYEEAEYCIGKLTDAGFVPIIAHAERYRFSVAQIYELCEQGCFVQVNYSNIMPRQFESSANSKVMEMLKDKRVSFLATDAHNIDSRPPVIEPVISYLYDNYDKEYIDKIIYEPIS